MEKQNVTLSLPKDILKQAKIVAVQQNTSLSQLLTDTLIEKVTQPTSETTLLRDATAVYQDGRFSRLEVFNMQQATAAFSQLTHAAQAQLLKWLVDAFGGPFPGIDVHPQVSGGEPTIVRSRIPVWVLVQAQKLGMRDADILAAYPTLRPEDLASAWAYYRLHPAEIDAQIAENEAA